MALFSASFRGAAGTATLPIAGLRSGTALNRVCIREIKIFTQAANSAIIRIVRLSTAGTATALTEQEMDPAPTAKAIVATAVHTYSSTAPTIRSGDVDVGMVGAAIGSGFHYTYYGEGKGLWIPGAASDAEGVALIEDTDTANTYSGTFIWEE
jgi:hypothetical protein